MFQCDYCHKLLCHECITDEENKPICLEHRQKRLKLVQSPKHVSCDVCGVEIVLGKILSARYSNIDICSECRNTEAGKRLYESYPDNDVIPVWSEYEIVEKVAGQPALICPHFTL
jgi:hypothetical protein